MVKLLLRVFFLIFVIASLFLIYISYFGIETNKFNSLIKQKANESHKDIKLDFKKTKIHLNPSKFNLIVKLKDSEIIIKDNKIKLSKLNLYLSLKSFFSSDFLLNKAEIAFFENDIKDLTKITRLYLPKIINKKLNKIFEKGKIEGEFIIPFNTDGSMGEKYGFSGKVLNASINLTKNFSIKNLTTNINYSKEIENGVIRAEIKKGSFFDLELENSKLNITRTKNGNRIETELHTNGKFGFENFKKLRSLLKTDTAFLKDIKGNINLKTNINFFLNQKFNIKNLTYTTLGNIPYLELHTKEKRVLKKYLPEYDPVIVLRDSKILLKDDKIKQNVQLSGLVKMKNDFSIYNLNQDYFYKKNTFDINGDIDLTDTKVNISKLNYVKKNGEKSNLFFNVNLAPNKIYNIKNLKFISNESSINASNVTLNKDFQLVDLKKIKVKTFLNNKKNNSFIIEKSKKIEISGEVFDAQPLLKSLYEKNKKKNFSKNFTSNIKINFKKTLTGTSDIISDFSLIALIKKGSFEKLSLKGNFSENEVVEMSIYPNDNDKKILYVVSDRAKPFVKNFDFIKGFEDGKLEYESVITKKESKANLKITDFKVSKVPAFAKLLTLASLQGIADTLSGEGIRFETFEMKSVSNGDWMDIKETYASGPAVSILLDGYVEKGKMVSLKGTLVPATTLNSIISTIPVVGSILVGKKTGEGVFGVSFKMKGPPKNIKTTVNPIKTLTPRFIVRAVEKMKKKKKN